MKQQTIICIILSVLCCVCVYSQDRQELTVMSYNIRLDVASDGENRWEKRKELLAGVIRFHGPDIVGLQEAQRHQIDYLSRVLPGYAWLGAGRDDGKDAGEFMAVFYRRDKMEVLHSSTFWCSPTPSVPGLGWDAAFNRVVTWAKFRTTASDQGFFLFNTHLDHVGVIARKESARLLMDSIGAVTGRDPVIVTGDFNSIPSDEPYTIMTGRSFKRTLFDSQTISSEPHYGPDGTFNGFNISEYGNKPIDYIFVSEGTTVRTHGTLTDSFYGRFPSDHFPLITTIRLNSAK